MTIAQLTVIFFFSFYVDQVSRQGQGKTRQVWYTCSHSWLEEETGEGAGEGAGRHVRTLLAEMYCDYVLVYYVDMKNRLEMA